jgi:hypothetical protein
VIGSDAVNIPPFAKAEMPGRLREVDFNGRIGRDILIPGFRSIVDLVVARLSGFTRPLFLSAGAFHDASPAARVNAFDDTGTLVWRHASEGHGFPRVTVAAEDLLIASHKAGGQVHAFDNHGKLLWKAEGGDADAGDVLGDEEPEIVTTDSWRLRVRNRSGAVLRDLDAGIPGHLVRVVKLSGTNRGAAIVAIGVRPGDSSVALRSLSATGQLAWSLQLPSKIRPPVLYSLSTAHGRPWFAVGMEDGQVFVVDAEKGAIIAGIDGQSLFPEVAWAEISSAVPRLVVATKTTLSAFTVVAR